MELFHEELWNPHLTSPCLPCRHRQAMGEEFPFQRERDLRPLRGNECKPAKWPLWRCVGLRSSEA